MEMDAAGLHRCADCPSRQTESLEGATPHQCWRLAALSETFAIAAAATVSSLKDRDPEPPQASAGAREAYP